MKARTLTRSTEDQVREVIDQWASAMRSRDAAGVLALYAPDTVDFGLAPPLRTKGAQATWYEQGIEAWFATKRGPIAIEHRDLQVTTSGDLALVHGLMRLTVTDTTGEESVNWVRQTFGLQRRGQAWRIVHGHTSVPFYMDGSDRAALDLEP